MNASTNSDVALSKSLRRNIQNSPFRLLRFASKIRFLHRPNSLDFQEHAMTRTFTLMLAALVWPGLENALSAGDNTGKVSESDSQFGSLSEAREAVTRVLRAAARTNGSPSRETTTSLASTYQQLARSEKVPAADRNRLLARIRTRLTEQELALRHEKQSGTSLSGSVANDAEMLLELIQSTIAPDTWEINGGRGSIFYFANR
jgi:hypothetical protein